MKYFVIKAGLYGVWCCNSWNSDINLRAALSECGGRMWPPGRQLPTPAIAQLHKWIPWAWETDEDWTQRGHGGEYKESNNSIWFPLLPTH